MHQVLHSKLETGRWPRVGLMAECADGILSKGKRSLKPEFRCREDIEVTPSRQHPAAPAPPARPGKDDGRRGGGGAATGGVNESSESHTQDSLGQTFATDGMSTTDASLLASLPGRQPALQRGAVDDGMEADDDGGDDDYFMDDEFVQESDDEVWQPEEMDDAISDDFGGGGGGDDIDDDIVEDVDDDFNPPGRGGGGRGRPAAVEQVDSEGSYSLDDSMADEIDDIDDESDPAMPSEQFPPRPTSRLSRISSGPETDYAEDFEDSDNSSEPKTQPDAPQPPPPPPQPPVQPQSDAPAADTESQQVGGPVRKAKGKKGAGGRRNKGSAVMPPQLKDSKLQQNTRPGQPYRSTKSPGQRAHSAGTSRRGQLGRRGPTGAPGRGRRARSAGPRKQKGSSQQHRVPTAQKAGDDLPLMAAATAVVRSLGAAPVVHGLAPGAEDDQRGYEQAGDFTDALIGGGLRDLRYAEAQQLLSLGYSALGGHTAGLAGGMPRRPAKPRRRKAVQGHRREADFPHTVGESTSFSRCGWAL